MSSIAKKADDQLEAARVAARARYATLELPEELPPGVRRKDAAALLKTVKEFQSHLATDAAKRALLAMGLFDELTLYPNAEAPDARPEKASTPSQGTPRASLRLAPGPAPVPPVDLEAETIALSGYLRLAAGDPGLAELLTPEDLHGAAQRRVLVAIEQAVAEGKAPTPALVRLRLKADPVAIACGAPAAFDQAERTNPPDVELYREVAAHLRTIARERRVEQARAQLARVALDGSLKGKQLQEEVGRCIAALDPRAEWDPPLIDGLIPADHFPLEALPKPLAEFIRVAAEVSFFPADFLALPCLAIAGAGIGRSVAVRVKEGWTEYPLLYSAIVGDPGSAKSAAIKIASAPVWALSRELLVEHQLLMGEIQNAQRKAEADRRAGGTPQRAAPPDEPKPRPRRVAVADTTCEAVALRLSENRRGLVMIQDELSGWLAGMNQYKGGGGNDRQFFLKIWSSASIPIDRKGQVDGIPIFLPEPFMSITGGIQPDVLDGLSVGDERDDGFVDRILFSYPDAVPMGFTRKSIPGEGPRSWDRAYRLLWGRAMAGEGDLAERPAVVGFTKKAERAFDEWCEGHCRETNGAHFPKHLRGPWRKMIVYAARLALIAEQLRWAYDPAAGPGDRPRPVGVEAVEAMSLMLAYFKTHFRRVYSSMKGGNADNDLARAVLGWIEKTERTAFTEREVRDNFRRRLEDEPPHSLDAALGWLVQRQAIRRHAPGVQGRGRPTSSRYDVNPYIAQSARKNQKLAGGNGLA